MIHRLIIVIIFIAPLFNYGQQTIEIKLCEDLVKKKEWAIYSFSVVDGLDTLGLAKNGRFKYFNPYNYCDSKNFVDVESDISKIVFVIETKTNTYKFEMERRDLFCPKMKLCLKYNKGRKVGKYVQWIYESCGPYGKTGVIKAIKN